MARVSNSRKIPSPRGRGALNYGETRGGLGIYKVRIRHTYCIKAVANEDTMLRTHCCGHKCFPVCPRAQHLLRTQNLCPRHKNVSDFFRKHFVSATNVSRFAQHRNNKEQQCVRNIVSSFAITLTLGSAAHEDQKDIKNYGTINP